MKTVQARIFALMTAAGLLGACQTAVAAEMDGLLAQLDRAPLVGAFCKLADERRAGLHRDASIDPFVVGEIFLHSAEVRKMTEEDRVGADAVYSDDWIVNGPILHSGTRYFVLVADPARLTEACAIKDLGERA